MSWFLLNTYFDVENKLLYQWHVLGPASNTFGYSWNVLNGAENGLGYSWNIWGFVDTSLGYGWLILNGIEIPLYYGWSVKNFFATNRPQHIFYGRRENTVFYDTGPSSLGNTKKRLR